MNIDNQNLIRFNNASLNYSAGRPTYPLELMSTISKIIPSGALVVDVGSGTGISSRLLIELGYNVIMIEPNRAMMESNTVKELAYNIIHSPWEDCVISEDSIEAVFFFMSFHYLEPNEALKKAKDILKVSSRRYICVVNYYLSQSDPVSLKYHHWLTSLDVERKNGTAPLVQDLVYNDILRLTSSHQTDLVSVRNGVTLDDIVTRTLSLPHVANLKYSRDFLKNQIKDVFELNSVDDMVYLVYEFRILFFSTCNVI